ncbi:MAG: bile acid:sodium symporter family protein [Pseudomonadota bacterium]
MIVNLFPVWALTGAMLGYLFPELFSMGRSAIVPLLMVVMLSMGLTLRAKDFLNLGAYKSGLILGLVLQFSVMPFAALGLSWLFGLEQELLIGMLLVGTVAGGTASNVMAYLAGGNVAMSVSMTAISTLASVALTPLLLTLLLGTSVNIPAYDMLLSLIRIILIPVAIGVICNTYLSAQVKKVDALLPPLSILIISFIIAIVVALNADRIATMGAAVAMASLAHNLTGLTLGYLGARLLGFDRAIRRTIALEVGMQNSGLATALALKFFTPVSALPGAVFSVWLNLTGSIYAAWCRRLDQAEEKIGG